MDRIEIIVKCRHCQQDNLVAIAKGDHAEPKCSGCRCVLMEYDTVNGYIYILSNPRMNGLVKIGFSTRVVEDRVVELNSPTGVPAPFELEAYFVSSKPEDDERQIHQALAAQRVQGREFFEVGINEAFQVATSVCKRPPVYLHPKNSFVVRDASEPDFHTADVNKEKFKGGWDFGPGTKTP